jgi:dCMP deaminase
MVIGLTGKNASGKGEIAKMLVAGGFEYFSLSDEIRAELAARGVAPSREAMIEEGRRLRSDHGLDVLARRVVARFTPGVNQVVDSVRNPEEVRFLRTIAGFFLVAADAPVEVRFERARGRARPGDPVDPAGFEDAERRELTSGDPAAQQLVATIALADFTVVNDGDMESLRASVNSTFREAARRVPRPGWDEYFMRIAEVVATRSSCVKRQVAAVVVRDKRVISTGYNGTPRNTRNCAEGGCERCLSLAAPGASLGDCVCSHAEENAIVQAAFHGVSLRGATIYSTFMPCVMCTKMIINSGIAEVVYRTPYPLPAAAASLFEEAGVAARRQ